MIYSKKCKFKVEIEIDFIDKEDAIQQELPIKKEYLYHKNIEGNEYKDKVSIRKDKIEISGERTRDIDQGTMFYTIKSRYYRECISVLLYSYIKIGAFTIKVIKSVVTKWNEKKIHSVPSFNQKFKTGFPFEVDELVLDSLFDYSDDSIYFPLMHLIEGMDYTNYKLEHSWKAFNYIYSTVYKVINSKNDKGKKGDSEKNAYIKMFDVMKSSIAEFDSIFQEAKELVLKEIDTNDAIAFFRKKDPQQISNIESFLTIFDIHNISDSSLLTLLEEMFDEIYGKHQGEYASNPSSNDSKMKPYRTVKKKFKECQKKSGEDTADYMMFLLNFVCYLRNKMMHGVIQSPGFLFVNDASKYLEVYGQFLAKLCCKLLNNDIYRLAESYGNKN